MNINFDYPNKEDGDDLADVLEKLVIAYKYNQVSMTKIKRFVFQYLAKENKD